jgi:hypothetical protein
MLSDILQDFIKRKPWLMDMLGYVRVWGMYVLDWAMKRETGDTILLYCILGAIFLVWLEKWKKDNGFD